MGFGSFVKGFFDDEVLLDGIIDQIVKQYKKIDERNMGLFDPHFILKEIWEREMLVQLSRKMSAEAYSELAFSETLKFACIAPHNNARALALHIISVKWPDKFHRFTKYGQEYSCLMEPVNFADKNGDFLALFGRFNPGIISADNKNVKDAKEPASRSVHVVEPKGSDFTAEVDKWFKLVIDTTISDVFNLEEALHDHRISGRLPQLQSLQYSQLVVECIIFNVHLADRTIYAQYGPSFRSKVISSILPSIAGFVEDGTLSKILPKFSGTCTFGEKEEVSSFYRRQKNVDAIPQNTSISIYMNIFDIGELDARFAEYSAFSWSNVSGKRAMMEKFSKNISECICDPSDASICAVVQQLVFEVSIRSLE